MLFPFLTLFYQLMLSVWILMTKFTTTDSFFGVDVHFKNQIKAVGRRFFK